VVEGIVLPEMLAFAGEDGVGLMGGGTLDSVRYAREGDFWRNQQVHVIGHYHKCVKGKVVQGGITFPNGFYDGGGNSGIA